MTSAARAAESSERIFSRERNLVAVAHCSNLALADGKFRDLLDKINPQNPFKKPLLQLLGPAVFNDGLNEVEVSHWAEAVLLSLPLEKDNDWVYVLRTSSRTRYIKTLLSSGNVRQELQEDGITRYRQTFENAYNVFFIAFTGDNLLLLSRNKKSLDITRRLYAFSSRDGLLASVKDDFSLIFHLNRYLSGEPRLLSTFSEELNRDLLRELAGSQAKMDNPFNLASMQSLKSLIRLLQEIAVLEFSADLQKDNVSFRASLLPSYGGNIHYALSNLPERKISLAEYLPQQAKVVYEGKAWKEAAEQLVTGAANVVAAMLGREVSAQVSTGADKSLEILNNTSIEEFAAGLVVPENAGKRCGPLWVGLLRFKDPQALLDGWKYWLDFFTVGELAEMLAEKGMRLELSYEPLRLPENSEYSSQVRIKFNSLYFDLPGVWGREQRVMLCLQGDTLVMVAPAAPLDASQYAEAHVYMLQQLRSVVSALGTEKKSTSPQIALAQKNLTSQDILSVSLHPLRYLQLAFLTESIWPQENPPNRLPVPWESYYKQFSAFPTLSTDVGVRVVVKDEALELKMAIPVNTLAETVRACLDIKMAGSPGGPVAQGGSW